MIEWLYKRYGLNESMMSLLAVGGRASGKSYTLFGGDVHEYDDRGVIPRILTELFDPHTIRASYCKISIYLLDGENIIDMLTTPPSVHVYTEGNVMKSDTLGPVLLCVQEVICKTASEAVELLYRALIAISIYTLSTVNVLSSFNTVVSIQWLGPGARSLPAESVVTDVMRDRAQSQVSYGAESLDNSGIISGGGGISMLPLPTNPTNPTNPTDIDLNDPNNNENQWYSLQCIEVASFECGPIVPTTLDRLSTFGAQFASARLLHDMVKKCPSSKYLNNLNCINNTMLTYMLQDTLFHVSN